MENETAPEGARRSRHTGRLCGGWAGAAGTPAAGGSAGGTQPPAGLAARQVGLSGPVQSRTYSRTRTLTLSLSLEGAPPQNKDLIWTSRARWPWAAFAFGFLTSDVFPRPRHTTAPSTAPPPPTPHPPPQHLLSFAQAASLLPLHPAKALSPPPNGHRSRIFQSGLPSP